MQILSWKKFISTRTMLIVIATMFACLCLINVNNVQAQNNEVLQYRPQVSIPVPGAGFEANKETPVGTYKDGRMNSDLLARYVKAIYDYGMMVAGILAAIVLMGGGLLWLSSAGNETRVSQAKELIIGSVSGIAILFSSWILLNTINPNLINLKVISLEIVNKNILESLLICEWKCVDIGSKCEGGGGHSTIASTGLATYPAETCQQLVGPQTSSAININTNKCPTGQDYSCCCKRKYTSLAGQEAADRVLACTENNGKPTKSQSSCQINNTEGYCKTIENSGGLTECIPCIAKGELCTDNTRDYECVNSEGKCGTGNGGDCNSRPTDGNFAQVFISYIGATTVHCNTVNMLPKFCPWPFGCIFSGGKVYIECKCE